jgi:hypothetical protein
VRSRGSLGSLSTETTHGTETHRAECQVKDDRLQIRVGPAEKLVDDLRFRERAERGGQLSSA